MKDGSLPLYYQETYFSNDTMLHPEIKGGQLGVAGDPVPYTVGNDDVITGVLLFCFVLAIVSFAHSRQYILQQLKNFFYIPRSDSNRVDLSNKFQLFLNLQTCLLLAIISFLYVTDYVADTFILDFPYQLIIIFFGVFLAYFVGRAFLYKFINTVFFSSKKSKHWTWTQTFITALEGIALFPAVMLLVYFDLPMRNVVYYLIFVLLLTKILTFYKCWVIFFRQMSVFLQIILYLCALEIIPLLSLVGVLVLITDRVKVIF